MNKKRIILNISIKDVFKQAIGKTEEKYPDFIWNSSIYNDIRSLNVSLTFRFGNNKSKSPDRKVDDSDKSRM